MAWRRGKQDWSDCWSLSCLVLKGKKSRNDIRCFDLADPVAAMAGSRCGVSKEQEVFVLCRRLLLCK